MSQVCTPHHDLFTAVLTFGLCCGLIISYAPQHLRIINKGSSEGFSPWFLLLGSTASAAGFLNMFIMQWHIIRCCPVFSLGSCVEMTAGVVQVGLQWLLFTITFVLYIFYYPSHLKYVEITYNGHETQPPVYLKSPVKSEEWRLSIMLAWVVAAHMFLISLITFIILRTVNSTPSNGTPLLHQISAWATFLGVSSAMLSAIQYAPQLIHTYKTKLVGALSIPTMCIQTPGAAFMVMSIALRPGTNWTSWIMFAISGLMQGTLLIMCIAWSYRQRRLGIDDFGNLLGDIDRTRMLNGDDEDVPGLVVEDGDNSVAIQAALTAALETAAGSDVRSGVQIVEDQPIGEDTPLLRSGSTDGTKGGWTWSHWFKK